MTWFWFAAGRDDIGDELQAVKSSKAQNRSTGSFRRKAITFHRKYCFPQSKLHSSEKSPISRLKHALYTPNQTRGSRLFKPWKDSSIYSALVL